MVPAAVVDKTIADLLPLLERGDVLIDGGNSYPKISGFEGRVSDSGEARWTIKVAIDEGVPVLTTALYERFSSRGAADLRASCFRPCAPSSAAMPRNRSIKRNTITTIRRAMPTCKTTDPLEPTVFVIFGGAGGRRRPRSHEN